MNRNATLQRLAGGIAAGFGLLTLVSGGSALSGAVDMGAVVSFVLWFNFLAGFAYVAGGILLWRGAGAALPVAVAILVATVAVFAAFGVQAARGGAYEMRTVAAMVLRCVFWLVMARLAWMTRAGSGRAR